jgi:hypothetical protein
MSATRDGLLLELFLAPNGGFGFVVVAYERVELSGAAAVNLGRFEGRKERADVEKARACCKLADLVAVVAI